MRLRLARWVRFAALGGALVAAPELAAAGPSPARPPRQFLPGTTHRLEDFPESRLRRQLERLTVERRQRAIEWLGAFHLTESDLGSLHVDSEGGIYYVDDSPGALSINRQVGPDRRAGRSDLVTWFVRRAQRSRPTGLWPPSAPTTLAPVPAMTPDLAASAAGLASLPVVPVKPFPTNLVFHSKPGAPNVLFLNFSGEEVRGTVWNTTVDRTVIPAVAFSTDGDYERFSAAEQLTIRRIWQRVAEDYAPFDIDVTTQRPATFGTRTAHALITRSTDANGEPNPSSTAGGVAYLGVFRTSTYATYRPAWIYSDNLAHNESYLAEAVSHEVGHNLGLSHDGQSNGTEYYNGHGSGELSWGPIMGSAVNRNLTQWSKGEYYLANNTQDDLATIAGKLAYRTDDHGNTRATATFLTLTAAGEIASTTPETDPDNLRSLNKGILERSTDVDVFAFATGAGPVSLAVEPWLMPTGLTRGGNLDVGVELYSDEGVLLTTNNPPDRATARLELTLPAGVYYLHIRNSGAGAPANSNPTGYTAYGSLGQYFITGRVVPAHFVVPPQAELAVADLIQPGTGAWPLTVTYADNVAIDTGTIDGADLRIRGPNGYDRPARLLSLDLTAPGTRASPPTRPTHRRAGPGLTGTTASTPWV
ncbi:MAG: hypothetical protein FJ387_21920 [Verrucomicrobia bacterium]|nr:hypothetical protein [Verrucomicrobiota bacterium]